MTETLRHHCAVSCERFAITAQTLENCCTASLKVRLRSIAFWSLRNGLKSLCYLLRIRFTIAFANRVEFTSQSRRSGVEIPAQSLRYRCAIAAQSLCNRCSIAVQ
jgi:hypothetical protein